MYEPHFLSRLPSSLVINTEEAPRRSCTKEFEAKYVQGKTSEIFNRVNEKHFNARLFAASGKLIRVRKKNK